MADQDVFRTPFPLLNWGFELRQPDGPPAAIFGICCQLSQA